MSKRGWGWLAGIGCLLVLFIFLGLGLLAYFTLAPSRSASLPQPTATVIARMEQATPVPLPTLVPEGSNRALSPTDWSLAPLYAQVNPGVVNIQVIVTRDGQTGQGAGSGFVIDTDGHIVTNNHVVNGATSVTVNFSSGLQASAEVVGVDPDSDLAVIKVEQLPEGVHPLALGDSDAVQPGEWVVAIGNPFGLGSSMSLGIVSAVGRTIPSGATPFDIPQAVQTDAAINPGNSGGPLMNLSGEVIGVNAQIASGGVAANAGVGFAIPSNVVGRVAPVLISDGSYTWPWIGVTGGSVNLAIMEANKLPSQQGAYIDAIVEDGPAASAGLRGSSGTTPINGVNAPVGGDVIVAVDGRSLVDFTDLLVQVTQHHPGDRLDLTVLRDGRERSVTIELAARPQQ